MKKALSLCMAIIMAFSFCAGLISCSNNGNNSEGNNQAGNNPDGNDPPSSEPFFVDLAGYVANIGSATALGISKNAKSQVSPVAYCRRSNSKIQLLSHSTLASENNSKNKNYIVMSTIQYDANAPEADESGLTKVTFTKTVTENVTTESTGSKVIKAHKEGLAFHAVEGFTYSVYEGDSLIYSNVCHNDENDANNKIGTILLCDLIDKVDYTVKYSGIGVETTITQDDINGEIDKLYVFGNYTFISFVPLGTSQRPDDSNLIYDANGIAAYDKTNYFSDSTHQSFVIDNSTGYIYQIKNIEIEKIENNLIIIAGKIYDMRVNDEGELEFLAVVQNETLIIQDYFKDKYGNKYIKNNVLDACDEVNQTLYYTESTYLISRENTVICIESNGNVSKLGKDFKKTEILSTESYTFNKSVNNKIVSHIDGGFLYSYTADGSFYRTNLLTCATDAMGFGVYGRIPVFDSKLQEWRVPNFEAFAIDYNTALMYYENNLYYCQIWGNELIHSAAFFDDIREGCVLLLENAEGSLSVQSVENLRFTKTTITGTAYYEVIVDENGIPKVVNSETYVAPEQTVITLQPLNK